MAQKLLQKPLTESNFSDIHYLTIISLKAPIRGKRCSYTEWSNLNSCLITNINNIGPIFRLYLFPNFLKVFISILHGQQTNSLLLQWNHSYYAVFFNTDKYCPQMGLSKFHCCKNGNRRFYFNLEWMWM